MLSNGNILFPGNAMPRGLDIGTRHLEKDGAPGDKLEVGGWGEGQSRAFRGAQNWAQYPTPPPAGFGAVGGA